MKKMKKVLSLILTVIMVLAMAVPSFAEGETGSISVSNPEDGRIYTIYQMFELESYDENSQAYSYKVLADWEAFVTDDAVGSKYFEANDQGYVTLKQGVEVADNSKAAYEIAQAALAYAIEKSIESSELDAENHYHLDNLSLGYYVVDSTLGTLCGLTTVAPTQTITEKNEAPTVEKKVKEDGAWADSNTAQIGDQVEFQITITAKEGATNYVLHDELSDGLTLDASSIRVDGLSKGTHYSVKTTEFKDSCDFEIIFDQEYLNGITQDTSIVIIYSATLNENAVIYGGDDANTNTVKLTYGDNNETTQDETETKTFSFDLVKTDENYKLLANAKFELYDSEEGGSKIPLVYENNVYRVATTTESTADGFKSAEIVTNGNSIVTIVGLDHNVSYWLEETQTPEGYNELDGRTEVKLTEEDNLSATMNDTTWTSGGVQITNKSGALLPSTGGIGTTIFYAAGIVLMAGAVFFVVRRKRA